MRTAVDLTGTVWGRWTVLHRAANPPGMSGPRWLCRCQCGTERVHCSGALRNGSTRGCPRCATRVGRIPKHGHATRAGKTTEYSIWRGMRNRCFSPKCQEFKRYGARGITVVDAWRTSFETFLRDMGPRPKGCSLDRIDNDGPYSPENCHWATVTEQNNNSRRNRRVLVEGTTMTLSQAAAHYKVPYQTFRRRFVQCGNVEEAARAPR
jgi:hypothetical protein